MRLCYSLPIQAINQKLQDKRNSMLNITFINIKGAFVILLLRSRHLNFIDNATNVSRKENNP